MPDNDIAENSQEDISVLFVLDVPETAEQLDAFMSAFHSVPNIFIFASDPEPARTTANSGPRTV